MPERVTKYLPWCDEVNGLTETDRVRMRRLGMVPPRRHCRRAGSLTSPFTISVCLGCAIVALVLFVKSHFHH